MPNLPDRDGAALPGVKGAQTLERGLDLLEHVAREPMPLTALADRAGLPRRTAARLVQGLIDRGFLLQVRGGHLRAGPKLIQLGAAAQSRIGLVATARAPLRALSARTGLSSFLGGREGDYSVHLHRTSGAQRVMVVTPVGTRRQLSETSLGKALLLDDDGESWRRLFEAGDPIYHVQDWKERMDRAAAAGVVIHEGPPPDSIRAVAMPVRDASGRVVGAISVASVAQYLDTQGLTDLVPQVREAAETISRALGWPGPDATSVEPVQGNRPGVLAHRV